MGADKAPAKRPSPHDAVSYPPTDIGMMTPGSCIHSILPAARRALLSYSLTLHAPDGERLVGFDNAHAVREDRGPRRRRRAKRDHRHRLRSIRPYEYTDAATLLEDFWKEVDQVLKERRALP